MRIAQVAPFAESVPPKLYGGTERVVSWLTEELVNRGHDVTLFATGDSSTRAKLVPVWPNAVRLARPRPDPAAVQAELLEAIIQNASAFDIMHYHCDWIHLPLASKLGVPFLTTLHGRLDVPGPPSMVRRFPAAPFVSISDNQRSPVPAAAWAGTVYYGLPLSSLRARYERGEYLAFLGRLTPEKGPEVAIRIARAANAPLRIAAKVPRGEARYFRETLEPLIDGNQIRLIGEVNDRRKQDFLSAATVLVFPINWPEPFGLVMIEAMACGTPVIAFGQGSVSEVIEDGVSGFVVDPGDEEGAVRAIKQAGALDRRRVRAAFERRFTAGRMTDDYLRIYATLIVASQQPGACASTIGFVQSPGAIAATLQARRTPET
ncbi:MAG: glycosyltransferase family 4 protein [Acetobacteraceae bacterium]|nr:glycosyltransferase family 4 protein [Acetobacteraceae bacterium]